MKPPAPPSSDSEENQPPTHSSWGPRTWFGPAIGWLLLIGLWAHSTRARDQVSWEWRSKEIRVLASEAGSVEWLQVRTFEGGAFFSPRYAPLTKEDLLLSIHVAQCYPEHGFAGHFRQLHLHDPVWWSGWASSNREKGLWQEIHTYRISYAAIGLFGTALWAATRYFWEDRKRRLRAMPD
ncbi:MAG: hypothetical protein QM755_00635 [Luteolibacter sp.]